MACGCNCRPPTPQSFAAPCTDCGPYGGTCCLKMTGLGETWYFRSQLEYVDRPSCGTSDLQGFPHGFDWVDGDDCDTIGYPGYGHQTNLCGQLSTASPCRKWGDLDGITPTSRRRPAVITWQVADDCSEVAFTLYYYDSDAVLTRYYATAGEDWLTTGGVTIGPFTIIPCPPGEPVRKQYNICCWQATIVTSTGTASGRTLGAAEPLPAICETDPRYQCTNTEQCGSVGGHSGFFGFGSPTGIYLNDIPGATGLTQLAYEVSQDYSTITFQALGFINTTPGSTTASVVYFTQDGTGSGAGFAPLVTTVPFTPEWFLTPVVFNATGASPGVSYAGATLTISVCGYEVVDPNGPCFDEELHPVFCDIDFSLVQIVGSGGTPPTQYEIGGTFAMGWTGSEYSSGFTTTTIPGVDWRIRIALSRETNAALLATLPPCSGDAEYWTTRMYVMDGSGAVTSSTNLDYRCIECGPDATFGTMSEVTPVGIHNDNSDWQVNATIDVYGA